jgi:ABC-type Mn2+/Zn2+ transport system permease subunit
VSATSHGASCGVVLGIVIVIFLQQIAYLDLSDFVPAIENLLIGAIVGGVIGAGIGYALGRSYLAKHDLAQAAPPK